MKINNQELKTGAKWAETIGLNILEPKGWDSTEDFNRVPIDKNEFFLRCSNSVLIPPKNKTRREMAAFRQNLMNKFTTKN